MFFRFADHGFLFLTDTKARAHLLTLADKAVRYKPDGVIIYGVPWPIWLPLEHWLGKKVGLVYIGKQVTLLSPSHQFNRA